MPSEVVAFYRGETVRHCRHILEEVWSYSTEELEKNHDYIQWLFPLDRPSAHNPDAPVLTENDIRTFRTNPDLLSRVLTSAEVFVEFLGKTPGVWTTGEDHNHLRITRMLKCLVLMGMASQARKYLGAIERTAVSFPHADPNALNRAFRFWESAAGGSEPRAEREQGSPTERRHQKGRSRKWPKFRRLS